MINCVVLSSFSVFHKKYFSVKKGLFLLALTASLPAAAQTSPVLDAVINTGKVKIGYVNNWPFAFAEKNAEPDGFSIDLCKQIVASLEKRLTSDKRLKRPLQIEYYSIQFDERIPKISSNEIYMECGSNTNTVERQTKVAFSYTMFVSSIRALTQTSLVLNDYRALDGKKVVAIKGTTGADAIAFRAQNLYIKPTFVLVDTAAEALKLIESRQADAFFHDDILLYGLRRDLKNPDAWHVTGQALTVEPYGFMLPKNDPKFVALVDQALAEIIHRESGGYRTLYSKWFQQADFKVPMSPLLREVLNYPSKSGTAPVW